jgi:hypothetical protein
MVRDLKFAEKMRAEAKILQDIAAALLRSAAS